MKTSRSDLVWKILLYTYIIGVLAVGPLIGYVVWKNHQLAQQTHRALCSLKHGYADQAASSRRFLKKHPDGIPSLQVSRADLKRSILSLDKRTHDLKDVNC